MSDERDYVQQRLALLIQSGFHSAEEALELLDDAIEELEAPPVWRKWMTKFAAELEQRQREREREWSERTTNDRLDAVFAELDGGRFVALQNAGYTMSEGWEDVHEHRARSGKTKIGAVFYHGQDLERGVAGEGLLLAYGTFDGDDPEGDVKVGREICEVFAGHGFELEWNGDPNQRLRVRPFAWQRRYFTRNAGCDLLVRSVPMESRMAVLKTCKKVLGMKLSDARAGLQTLEPAKYRWDEPEPWVVLRGLSEADAERFAAALEEAGAVAFVRR